MPFQSPEEGLKALQAVTKMTEGAGDHGTSEDDNDVEHIDTSHLQAQTEENLSPKPVVDKAKQVLNQYTGAAELRSRLSGDASARAGVKRWS